MVKSKFFLIFFALFALNFNIYSQDNFSNNLTENETQIVESEEELIDDYFDDSKDENNNFKAPSTVGTILKLVVFLVLVVAAIYGLMWFFKKKSNVSKSDDDFMRRVSTLYLAPGKSVEIVTLLDHAYLLGVTDNNINLLGEIDDKEFIEAMNLNFDKKQTVKKPMNFSDVLDMFMPNGPREKKNIFADTESKINNLSNRKKNQNQE